MAPLPPISSPSVRRVPPGARRVRLPAIGSTDSFSEVNVRTYVTGPARPGVWFHSLDASSGLAVRVARAAWSLPYVAADVRAQLSEDGRSWTVRRRDGTSGALRAEMGGPADHVRGADPVAVTIGLPQLIRIQQRPWVVSRPGNDGGTRHG